MGVAPTTVLLMAEATCGDWETLLRRLWASGEFNSCRLPPAAEYQVICIESDANTSITTKYIILYMIANSPRIGV